MITVLALILMIVGALNWMSVGIFDFNFINWIFTPQRRTCRHLDGRLSDLQQVQPEAHQRDRKGRKQRTTRRISVTALPKSAQKDPKGSGR